jgi:hypothetical protein
MSDSPCGVSLFGSRKKLNKNDKKKIGMGTSQGNSTIENPIPTIQGMLKRISSLIPYFASGIRIQISRLIIKIQKFYRQ